MNAVCYKEQEDSSCRYSSQHENSRWKESMSEPSNSANVTNHVHELPTKGLSITLTQIKNRIWLLIWLSYMPTYVPTYILKYMCFAVNSAEQESSFALK
jgi:hypothetical protein